MIFLTFFPFFLNLFFFSSFLLILIERRKWKNNVVQILRQQVYKITKAVQRGSGFRRYSPGVRVMLVFTGTFYIYLMIHILGEFFDTHI